MQKPIINIEKRNQYRMCFHWMTFSILQIGSILSSFLLFFLLLSATSAQGQVRNGWRSVFDKKGRLTRMNFYRNGEAYTDSNYYFQYYSGNQIKGLVKGTLSTQYGCQDGSVFLFTENGILSNFSINNNGQKVLNVNCDDYGNCTSTWSDDFERPTNLWQGDSMSIGNGELTLYSRYNMAAAIYNPPVPIYIERPFNCQIKIPKQGNSAKQGIVLGWKDPDNYYLFELSYGRYYSVLCYKNGELEQLTEARVPISKEGDEYNTIKISNNGNSILFDLNGTIEYIMPIPEFVGNKFGLVSRSRGAARFSDLKISYTLDKNDDFYQDKWVGRGSGFFVSGNKILTTFSVIENAHTLRVKTESDGKQMIFPAKLIREDERNDLALLEIIDTTFAEIDSCMIGLRVEKYGETEKLTALGYPHSLSGLLAPAIAVEGSVIPQKASKIGSLILEMPFRYGMIGSPVVDHDMNLVGIVSAESYDINYSEIIDYYNNRPLVNSMIGVRSSVESPMKGLNRKEQLKRLEKLTVIIESYIFEEESPLEEYDEDEYEEEYDGNEDK